MNLYHIAQQHALLVDNTTNRDASMNMMISYYNCFLRTQNLKVYNQLAKFKIVKSIMFFSYEIYY